MASKAETLRGVIDTDMPREALWSLKYGRKLGPLAEREGKWEVIRTLGAIALLDRNWQVYEGLTPKQTHIETDWEELQSRALKETANLGGEEAALMLFLVVKATRMAFNLPGEGPAEIVLGQRVTNIERQLTTPAYERILNSGLSFRWLPWHPTWRGYRVWIFEHLDEGPSSNYLIRGDERLKLYPIEERQGQMKERACEALAGVEGPLVTELLLRLGSDKWGGILREIAVKGLGEKGLGRKKAELLCRSLEPFDLTERWRLAKELAVDGLEKGGEVMIERYGEERQRTYVGRLAEEIEGMEKDLRDRGIKGKIKSFLRPGF